MSTFETLAVVAAVYVLVFISHWKSRPAQPAADEG
jgi:hypothetical protein